MPPRSSTAPSPPAGPERTIENPVTGERVRWMVTGEQSGGRLVRAEVCVRPGGAAIPEHVHGRSEERFEPLAGELTLEVLGRRRIIRPGERATVAPGVPIAGGTTAPRSCASWSRSHPPWASSR